MSCKMNRFYILLFLWFYCMDSARTCGVQRGPNAYQIVQYFDKIMLTGANDSISLSNLTKTGYVRTAARPVDRIYRLPPGETIELHCTADIHESPGQDSVWTLNGKVLNITTGNTTGRLLGPHFDSCSCRLQSATDYLRRIISRRVNDATGSDILTLKDHTHMHAGEYECMQQQYGRLVVLKRYLVSPKLTAREVFDPPMKSIWARTGEAVHFPCAVRFHALAAFEKRFIWRNDRRIVAAEGVKEFKNAVLARSGFGAIVHYRSNGTCGCHSTLVIHKVTRRHAGLYQCWFRVDDLFDEWIVQTAYLTVAD